MKALFITEKPSVAREFAAALNINAKNRDGYMEGDKAVITWCVGHLVTMSYPDQYDPALKKWDLETIPFIPDNILIFLIGKLNLSKHLKFSTSILLII